jgi:hypothetical protein
MTTALAALPPEPLRLTDGEGEGETPDHLTVNMTYAVSRSRIRLQVA